MIYVYWIIGLVAFWIVTGQLMAIARAVASVADAVMIVALHLNTANQIAQGIVPADQEMPPGWRPDDPNAN